MRTNAKKRAIATLKSHNHLRSDICTWRVLTTTHEQTAAIEHAKDRLGLWWRTWPGTQNVRDRWSIHQVCQKCGQDVPALTHQTCCDVCGTHCNLQDGCGSEDCKHC